MSNLCVADYLLAYWWYKNYRSVTKLFNASSIVKYSKLTKKLLHNCLRPIEFEHNAPGIIYALCGADIELCP